MKNRRKRNNNKKKDGEKQQTTDMKKHQQSLKSPLSTRDKPEKSKDPTPPRCPLMEELAGDIQTNI
jgi:hypothetical protein